MREGPHIAQVAALMGDPARANMLAALLDGRALTAGELAGCAGVQPPTASAHLGKLVDANLLAVMQRGRNRYFRLASPLVGQALEGMMALAQTGPAEYRPHWRGGEALRTARTCYDHLAGRLGVAIAEALAARGDIALTPDGGEVTASGLASLAAQGIDLGAARTTRRVFCRPCLDWSERRLHLGGAVGAAIAAHAFAAGWIARAADSRAVAITPAGAAGFAKAFGVAPHRAE